MSRPMFVLTTDKLVNVST